MLNDPMRMRGLIEIIKDATLNAIENVNRREPARIVPPTKNPGFLNGVRRMK